MYTPVSVTTGGSLINATGVARQYRSPDSASTATTPSPAVTYSVPRWYAGRWFDSGALNSKDDPRERVHCSVPSASR
jgi:hypothetical protein